MCKRGLVFCVIGLGLVLNSASARADKIESVGKELAEKSKKIKSLTADIRTVTEMETQGYKSKTTSEGRFEMLCKDGKTLTRIESKDSSTTDIGGKTEKRESTMLSIMDGEYVYTYTQIGDQKAAYKMKSQVNWDQDPFEALRKTNDLELLPDEKIDGVDVYVVQATPKGERNKAASGKTVLYYRKDCGFPVKSVTFDAAGKPMSTMTYTDLKLDAEIKPDRFVFKAPEGVEVVDMTKMTMPPGEQGGEAGAGKGEQPKKDKPAKKDEEPKKPGSKLPKLPDIPKRP